MKVTKTELKEMVQKIVSKKLADKKQSLNEGTDFSARRRVAAQAKSASMEFENTIVSELGVANPDSLSEPLQRKYYEIVKGMETHIVKAAMEAVTQLAQFPKEQDKSAK